uniref:NB-ARC domain-containing protein n=1 Tax=Leersia perrieri TaxID=77586 RepID=A0A0D9VBE6_9ORYZ
MGLVGTVVDAAIEWMVQSILGSFFHEEMKVWTHKVGLAENVATLESEMKSVQMVLAAAEGRRIDNRPLSDSLDELNELLYDAEDVMDELDYYRLQQQIEGKGCNAAACIKPDGSHVSSYSPSLFQQVSSKMNEIIVWAIHGRKRKREELTHGIMLPPEIKHKISERIDGIANCLRIKSKSVQEVLQLEISRPIVVSKQSQSVTRSARLTTSIPIERKVYGRDAEKENIIELLTKGNSSDLGVLPLVGIGGVGKTTLARFVYHDQRIKNHFDLRMWVCVSDNFNEKSITYEMLELVCKGRQRYGNITSFDALQETLLEKIRRKRFLLVLDDVWEDEDRSGWDKLLAPLRFNEANGCMILATTRRTSVARMIGTMSKVEVNGLNDTEFWLLFKACAFFGNENQEHDSTMQSIGQHIAKVLKGNPLAARSVGALLNRNVNFEHWRKVQYKWRSLIEQDDDILTILKFSYEFLPVHLQQCFSYCSLFPKDHKFRGEKLVRAWIAQNFVECECHTERLEETGKQYLDNLVDWGFFEEVESHYIMHDLMHDLAGKVSANECATIDGVGSKKVPSNVRHLSIITTAYDDKPSCSFPSEKFDNILNKIMSLQKLRTLMFFGESSVMLLRSLHTLCKESKSLRLLRIYVTADDISATHNLLNPCHLRYVEFIVVPNENISGCVDFVNTSVPQALTQFYHLQVLDASSRANIVVPAGMNNLVNLRHLIAHEKVHSTIAGVGNLTSLQELAFKVQDDSTFNIGQLRSLNNLVILAISQLENVKTKEEAKGARLIDKEHLQKLSLSWNDNSMSSEPTVEKTRDDVFEGLEPHQNLKNLELIRYGGATSPTWLASKVKALQVLHLENCREWQIVNSLEMLPVLRKLKLTRMWNLMSVSIPSYLEELILVNTPKLEKCVGTYGQDLTSGLRVLVVKDCPCLNEFTPFHSDYFHTNQKSWFPSLNKLTIGHCHRIISWKKLPLEKMGALKELELMDMPVVEELSAPSLEKILPFHNLKGLMSMHLQNCPNLIYVSSEVFSQLIALERLVIEHCPKLFLPHVMSKPVHGNSKSNTDHIVLPSLKSLRIDSCGIAGRWLTQMLPCLQSIEELLLSDCPQIKLLLINHPTETEAANSLASTEITTYRDEQLLKIPCNLFHTLKWLHIGRCPDLEFSRVNEGFAGFTSLLKLHIWKCPKLVSSLVTETNDTNGLLPMSLEDLEISPLPVNLESYSPKGLPCLKKLSLSSIPVRLWSICRSWGVLEGLQHLSSLRSLDSEMNAELSAAWNLKLFPLSPVQLWIRKLEGSFRSFSLPCPPSIRNLNLWDSPELVSLQLGYCTALEELDIRRCKSLASIEGFESIRNLRSLVVLFSPSLPPYLHGPYYPHPYANSSHLYGILQEQGYDCEPMVTYVCIAAVRSYVCNAEWQKLISSGSAGDIPGPDGIHHHRKLGARRDGPLSTYTMIKKREKGKKPKRSVVRYAAMKHLEYMKDTTSFLKKYSKNFGDAVSIWAFITRREEIEWETKATVAAAGGGDKSDSDWDSLGWELVQYIGSSFQTVHAALPKMIIAQLQANAASLQLRHDELPVLMSRDELREILRLADRVLRFADRLRDMEEDLRSEILLWKKKEEDDEEEIIDLRDALDGLQHLSFLRELNIEMNHELSAAWDLKLREQERSGNQLGFCPALEELSIFYCRSLASIEGFQFIRNLRALKVHHSPAFLPYLEQQEGPFLSPLAMALENALGCNGKPMVSLTEEQERALQLLTSLKQLQFCNCKELESLPANLRSLDSLETLTIWACPNIPRLPELGLPPEELRMQCKMAETEQLRGEEWNGRSRLAAPAVYCMIILLPEQQQMSATASITMLCGCPESGRNMPGVSVLWTAPSDSLCLFSICSTAAIYGDCPTDAAAAVAACVRDCTKNWRRQQGAKPAVRDGFKPLHTVKKCTFQRDEHNYRTVYLDCMYGASAMQVSSRMWRC